MFYLPNEIKYVVDINGKRIAVQMNMKIYEVMKKILEDPRFIQTIETSQSE